MVNHGVYMKICPECNKEHKETKRAICGTCRVRRARRKTKQRAVNLLGGSCIKCGYSKSLRALEFHHKDPNEKDIQISVSNNVAWSRIEEELKKCILVCSNCHAEIHEEIEKNKQSRLS
jgi:hypothetical protein